MKSPPETTTILIIGSIDPVEGDCSCAPHAATCLVEAYVAQDSKLSYETAAAELKPRVDKPGWLAQ